MKCSFLYEVEDERGVLKKNMPSDIVIDTVYSLFTRKFKCEAIHATKWIPDSNPFYRYEGTVYLKNGELIIFQVTTLNRLYFILKSETKSIITGKELKKYSNVYETTLNVK